MHPSPAWMLIVHQNYPIHYLREHQFYNLTLIKMNHTNYGEDEPQLVHRSQPLPTGSPDQADSPVICIITCYSFQHVLIYYIIYFPCKQNHRSLRHLHHYGRGCDRSPPNHFKVIHIANDESLRAQSLLASKI